MRKLPLLCILAGVAPALPAQCPATTTFTTLFAGTTYLGTPDPMVGANVFFDLTASLNVTICELDVNLLDDGSQTPSQIGATTQIVFWTTPGTYVNNHTNQNVWTQLGTGTLTVAGTNQPSTVVFNPPLYLQAGTYGIALQHLPSTSGPNPGPIHPLYTDPAVQTTPLVHTDPVLTLTAGAAQNVAFVGGLATPRIVNTNIRYTPDPNTAMWSSFGAGCYPPNELTLASDARPIIGTGINLVTSNIPTGVTAGGLLFVGVSQVNPGIELSGLGMPNCYQHINPSVVVFFGVMGASQPFPLAIPNSQGLVGFDVYYQSATLSVGVNSANLLTSNGVHLRVGR